MAARDKNINIVTGADAPDDAGNCSAGHSLSLTRRDLLNASAGLVFAAGAAASGPRATAGGTAEAVGGDGSPMSVERYILGRLKAHGATKLFGVPGKTCEALFAQSAAAGVELVVTSSDLEAGYAADGFARVAGLGAVAVTYGVGTLSLINAIAGAYAERSPVIVINGGPSAADLNLQLTRKVSFSHSSGRRRHGRDLDRPLTNADVLVDKAMFTNVTCYAARADSIDQVNGIVEAALNAALTEKRPAYIEIAKELWGKTISGRNGQVPRAGEESGAERTVARDIMTALGASRRPLMLVGIEVARFGLQSQVEDLVRRLGIPWTTTLLAKAAIAEDTPRFIGVYDGAYAPTGVRNVVAASDCVLALGCMFGVQYRGLFTNTASRSRMFIHVSEGLARFKGRAVEPSIELGALVRELSRVELPSGRRWEERPRLAGLSFDQRRASQSARTLPNAAEAGLSYDTVMKAVSDRLTSAFITITDTSLSMYPAADLDIKGAGGFMANAVWQSIGFSVGAAVGAGLAGGRRPIVVCGDGGFQMTAQALSTLARRRVPAIVVVLDNAVYGIEQYLIDSGYYTAGGAPSAETFLSLNAWAYEDLAVAMGFEPGNAVKVATTHALAGALDQAMAGSAPFFIRVMIKPHDLPNELRPT